MSPTPPKEKPPAAEVAGEKPDKPAEDEQAFTVDDLIARSDGFLGVRSHELAGAFAGVAGNKEVTLTEARARLKDWRKAPEEKDTP